jgi:hypothetical protein
MSGNSLTDISSLDLPLERYLEMNGTIFRSFQRQDSGNRAFGVKCDGGRYFVKEAIRSETAAGIRRALGAGNHPGRERIRRQRGREGPRPSKYDQLSPAQ